MLELKKIFYKFFFLNTFFLSHKTFFPKKNVFQTKNFTKKIDFILIVFFSIKKFVFHHMFAKFSFLSRMYAISSLQCHILRRSVTSYLCICVILAYAASRVTFMVIFSLSVSNVIVQSFSGAKVSSPSRFLFLIITSCCKYSKNHV